MARLSEISREAAPERTKRSQRSSATLPFTSSRTTSTWLRRSKPTPRRSRQEDRTWPDRGPAMWTRTQELLSFYHFCFQDPSVPLDSSLAQIGQAVNATGKTRNVNPNLIRRITV